MHTSSLVQTRLFIVFLYTIISVILGSKIKDSSFLNTKAVSAEMNQQQNFSEEVKKRYTEQLLYMYTLCYDNYEILYFFNNYILKNKLSIIESLNDLKDLSMKQAVTRFGEILQDIINRIKIFSKEKNRFDLDFAALKEPNNIDFMKIISEIMSLKNILDIYMKSSDNKIINELLISLDDLERKIAKFLVESKKVIKNDFSKKNLLDNFYNDILSGKFAHKHKFIHINFVLYESENTNPIQRDYLNNKVNYDDLIPNKTEILLKIKVKSIKASETFLICFKSDGFLDFLNSIFDDLQIIRKNIEELKTVEFDFNKEAKIFKLFEGEVENENDKAILNEIIIYKFEQSFCLSLISILDSLHKSIEDASSTRYTMKSNILLAINKIDYIFNNLRKETIESFTIEKNPDLSIYINVISNLGEHLSKEELNKEIERGCSNVLSFKEKYENLLKIKDGIINKILEIFMHVINNNSKKNLSYEQIKEVIIDKKPTENRKVIDTYLDVYSIKISEEIKYTIINQICSNECCSINHYPLVCYMDNLKRKQGYQNIQQTKQ